LVRGGCNIKIIIDRGAFFDAAARLIFIVITTIAVIQPIKDRV
jgi:hypothetical protein